MKLSSLLVVCGVLAVGSCSTSQWYPLNRKAEIPVDFKPYEAGQDVLVDCIQRNIDNGEHKFDDKDRIIYSPFPNCRETGKPLKFSYGVNQDINCTIGFTDELFHLFQLYIHEDAPFSCRIPFSSEQNYIESGGAFIPLTFNVRGEIHDAHLDIDANMNILLTKPQGNNAEENTIISAVAYSSGTNATRVVIGDYLTFNFAVRWLNNIPASNSNGASNVPFADGFYKFPLNTIPMSYTVFFIYLGLSILATGAIVLGLSYKSLSQKIQNKHYKSMETDFGKED